MSPFTGIVSEFTDLMTDTATYSDNVTTNTATGVTTAQVALGTLSGVFWDARQAEKYIGERLSAEVDGVMVHDKAKVTFDIKDSSSVVLNTASRNFSVVNTNDVGLQNSAFLVYLKEDRRDNG